jgi:hypothetical protein
MSTTSPQGLDQDDGPELYDVPSWAGVRACRGCGARISFVVGKAGAIIPVSLDNEHAERHPDGHVLRAPSHFTDCPEAGKFSRNR